MKRRSLLQFLGLASVAVPVGVVAAPRESPIGDDENLERWELPSRIKHRIIDYSYSAQRHARMEGREKSLTDMLDEQSRDGFELITVTANDEYIFGRRVPLGLV